MTNEEAIEWLKDEYEHARCDECIEGEYVNALETAIKALKSQLIIPSDARNGDVLKTIFGAKFIRNTLNGVVCDLDGEIEFNDNWWFAPYKEDESEE